MKTFIRYISRSFSLLNKNDKRKFMVFLVFQSLMSILDIIGIAIIGILGLVAINGYSGNASSGVSARLIELTHLSNVSFFARVIILCAAASSILLSRTVITIYVTKKGLFFLARVTSELTVKSFSKFLKSPFPEIQSIPSQEAIFLLTTGVNRLILGVLGSCIVLVTDGVLILLIIGSLLAVDFKLAFSAASLFIIVGFVLRKFSGNKSKVLSKTVAGAEISINSLMKEVLENYREISVKNSWQSYLRKIAKISKYAMAKDAEIAFLPLSSKYVIESSLILVSFLLGGFQFVFNDAKTAISTLALFMAAGARVMPAVLRIQQSVLSIQSSAGTSEKTWELLKGSIQNNNEDEPFMAELNFNHGTFSGSIEINNVKYTHADNPRFTLKIESLTINSGELIAVVGASGSGKSTFADLILGILKPNSGTILINGQSPSEIVKMFPGSVAYVPQKVFISDATVRENVTLGYENQEVVDNQIVEVLKNVHLDDWLGNLSQNLDSKVGESGYSMSGGQQQRLGIARALYTQPKLLLMDEATSALDGDTERYISETISKLKGESTVIMIAHRLSTVRNADRVFYFHDGTIIADGTFDAVRKQVPDFDRQAQLMGL